MTGIFKETGIQVFSVSEIAGFKEGSSIDLTHGWFGSGGDSYDSIMLFSFTGQDKAEKALDLIAAYNQSAKSQFPIRGFILPVEKSGY